METIGEKAEGKSLTRSVTKKSTQKRRITNCESCMNYEYDEEYEYYAVSYTHLDVYKRQVLLL